jgi:hypothetical protein
MRRSPCILALSSLAGWALFLGVAFERPELFMVAVPLIAALLSAREVAPQSDTPPASHFRQRGFARGRP